MDRIAPGQGVNSFLRSRISQTDWGFVEDNDLESITKKVAADTSVNASLAIPSTIAQIPELKQFRQIQSPIVPFQLQAGNLQRKESYGASSSERDAMLARKAAVLEGYAPLRDMVKDQLPQFYVPNNISSVTVPQLPGGAKEGFKGGIGQPRRCVGGYQKDFTMLIIIILILWLAVCYIIDVYLMKMPQVSTGGNRMYGGLGEYDNMSQLSQAPNQFDDTSSLLSQNAEFNPKGVNLADQDMTLF